MLIVEFEGLQEIFADLGVMFENVGVPGVVGAVPDEGEVASVFTLAAVDRAEVFPASSTAPTV